MENQNQKIKIFKFEYTHYSDVIGVDYSKSYIGLTTLPLNDMLKKLRTEHQDWLNGKSEGKNSFKLIWTIFYTHRFLCDKRSDVGKSSKKEAYDLFREPDDDSLIKLSILEKLPAETPKTEVVERLSYHIKNDPICINKVENTIKTSELKKAKIRCECGMFVYQRELNKHKKTQRHSKLLEDSKFKMITCKQCNAIFQASHLERHQKSKMHKDFDNKKNGIKINCECGSIIYRINQNQHNKTEKHQEWLNFYGPF